MSHRYLPHLATWCLPALLLGLACKPITKHKGEQPSGSIAEPTRPAETFGAKLGASPEAALAQVLASPADYAGKTVRVDGHVRRACSAKGCWMELAASTEPNAPACRVTFKDYGFFVPTDSAGARARIEGEVAVKRVPRARVEHYEAEGATFPSKHEDGSADEVRFVATGVELRR